MRSFVTSKNVKWCHLIWPTLYIHTHSFITQNDKTHLHKITNTRKNTNKSTVYGGERGDHQELINAAFRIVSWVITWRANGLA